MPAEGYRCLTAEHTAPMSAPTTSRCAMPDCFAATTPNGLLLLQQGRRHCYDTFPQSGRYSFGIFSRSSGGFVHTPPEAVDRQRPYALPRPCPRRLPQGAAYFHAPTDFGAPPHSRLPMTQACQNGPSRRKSGGNGPFCGLRPENKLHFIFAFRPPCTNFATINRCYLNN